MRALIYLVAVSVACAADADVILHHGSVLTVDAKFTEAEAVAVKGNRIVRVGTDKEVLAAERGPRTRVIDLKGKSVLPGLIDNHVHTLSAGLSEFREPAPRVSGIADIQRYLLEKAKTTPKGEWLFVPRTFATRLKETRIPTRYDLDVVKDHPVFLDSSYVTVLNSKGLEVCGITRNTPDPPAGQVVKDDKGEPNGVLRNAPSLLKKAERIVTFSEAEKSKAMREMLERYRQAGLTSVTDRAVTPEDVAIYEKLKAAGALPVRVVMTWRIDAARPTADLVKEIKDRPWTTGLGDDWLKFATFKVTLDGGMIQGTAYQRMPYGPFGRQLYGITDQTSRGQLFIPQDKLLAIMTAARDKGWSLTAHSQGGGAVDTLLNVFEELNRQKPLAPTRSHVMHASFQSPEAIARAKKIGVEADVQPMWLYHDAPALEKVFDYDRMRYFIPLRTYINAGTVVAGGSDHMIGHDKNNATNPYNPFFSMWVAVTRKMSTGRVLHPDEKITREEALKMYTVWPAYLQFAERQRGSIEAGKLADLVVIDRDYLRCPEDEIRVIQPRMVMVDGNLLALPGSAQRGASGGAPAK